MRKTLLFFASLLCAWGVMAQNNKDPESSTFGLDEKDAAAVREIRYKMAQIRKTRPTVALVLSGGGAKGAATVGALKYLEQYDFPVDMVVGTSIGGMVGAMYALGYDADYLDSLFKHMDWSVALSDKVDRKYVPYSRIRYKEKFMLSFPFYYRADDYKNFIQGDMPFAAGSNRQLRLGAENEGEMSSLARNSLLGSLPSGFVFGQNVNQIITSRTVGYSDSTNFFKLPIPFACVATDMASGKAKVWHAGSINLAIRSTMSIPGLFAPVRTEGMVLVDGGMRNNFPVNIARQMGADIIIGIDLSGDNASAAEIQNLADILSSTMNLFDDDAFNQNIKNVDLRIHPDMTGYNFLSFNRAAIDTLFNRGYKAAEALKPQLDAVRHRLGKARRKLNAKPAVDLGARPVRIEDIDIVGVDEREAEYIRSKMSVKPGMEASKDQIETDIAAIFGKGSYDYVTYELRGKAEPYRLRVLCKRGPMHQIGLGARMDTQDIVSLLLNVGLFTHSMSGSSVDLTARISINPYVDVRYSYNAPNFSTFNVRADVRYLSRTSFLAGASTYNIQMLNANQEVYFSNMHWSSFDVKLGLKNNFTKIFNVLSNNNPSAVYELTGGSVLDYMGLIMDGRMETLDNGYFPTKGVSVGLRAEAVSDVRKWGNSFPVNVIAALDGKFPITFGRFTLIPQYNIRFIFGPQPPVLYANMIGDDFQGRYLDHSIPFVGVNQLAVVRDQLAILRLDARFRILKNHYVTLMGNGGYSFDAFNKTIADGKWLGGVGLGYAYNSIVGPIKGTLHWSNVTNKVGFYLSLGYNF